MARSKDGVVDTLADRIALRVLQGELLPGSRLPSVRALAAQHGVNVSTVQRVLATLEERGVVATRPRSGVEVLDLTRHGGTALWPLLLRHASDHPERAVALVRDALETRRLLAVHVGRALMHVPFERYGSELFRAIERFAEAARAAPSDLTVLVTAENEIFRTALLAARRFAVLGVYNDIADMLLSSPVLQREFYRDPAVNLAGWQMFAEMLRAGGSDERLSFVEPLLASLDERVVRAYAATLGIAGKQRKASTVVRGSARRSKPSTGNELAESSRTKIKGRNVPKTSGVSSK